MAAVAAVGAAGLGTTGHAPTTRELPPARAASVRFAVGVMELTFAEPGRTVTYPGQAPTRRTVTTVIRYPAALPSGRTDVRRAPPDRAHGPFPLIVFGHGFAVTPATYYRLLRAWARAGYVVAAPVFPLENAHAPGGPTESDLPHQPHDMSVVISGMLAASSDPHSLLHSMINRRAVAAGGQSDGGVTALALAYDPVYRDRRVKAAVILSGAQVLGTGSRGPPLLAAQGTADTVNAPQNTDALFAAAQRPKFLLRLIGAAHLPPYTVQQPQLTIVERVSVAFLDRYLKRDVRGITRMERAGNRRAIARLVAEP